MDFKLFLLNINKMFSVHNRPFTRIALLIEGKNNFTEIQSEFVANPLAKALYNY